MDITDTIIPKTDQLNADSLLAGPMTIRIREVVKKNDPQQPLWIYYDGDNNKPWKPCLSMRRALVHVWGKDGGSFVGKSVTLFANPDVIYGGKKVGGIRISHMSGVSEKLTFMLTDKKGSKSPYTVFPLVDDLAPLREAATQGTEAFRAAWKVTPKDVRSRAEAELASLQATAKTADETATLNQSTANANADA